MPSCNGASGQTSSTGTGLTSATRSISVWVNAIVVRSDGVSPADVPASSRSAVTHRSTSLSSTVDGHSQVATSSGPRGVSSHTTSSCTWYGSARSSS